MIDVSNLFVSVVSVLFYTAIVMFGFIILMVVDIKRRIRNKDVKI